MNNEVRYGFRINEIKKAMEHMKYVHENTESPLQMLLWLEVRKYINDTKFSNSEEDNIINATIVELHCYGLTDLNITELVNKHAHRDITVCAIKKRRQRALKAIRNKYKNDIGVITVMHEVFGNDSSYYAKKVVSSERNY